MATQNNTVDAGIESALDFSKNDAALTDLVFYTVSHGGTVRLMKLSDGLGGNNEIDITASTKYSVNLKESDTLNLPASGVTHRLVKVSAVDGSQTELFSGTLTVNNATESVVFNVGSAIIKKYTQQFSADGVFDIDFTTPVLILGMVLKAQAASPTIGVNIGTTSGGNEIVQGQSLSSTSPDTAPVYQYPFILTAENLYVNNSGATQLSANPVTITIYWMELN